MKINLKILFARYIKDKIPIKLFEKSYLNVTQRVTKLLISIDYLFQNKNLK